MSLLIAFYNDLGYNETRNIELKGKQYVKKSKIVLASRKCY